MKHKIYYTTSGDQTLAEFIETEVKERGNYTSTEIKRWKKKYHLTDATRLIWVTPLKWRAFSYTLPASEMENAKNIPENEMDVTEIKADEGFIIPESDDGDDGFVFVYREAHGQASVQSSTKECHRLLS
jgi:hypothetical protein